MSSELRIAGKSLCTRPLTFRSHENTFLLSQHTCCDICLYLSFDVRRQLKLTEVSFLSQCATHFFCGQW